MINTIFLDMDGVLDDLVKRCTEEGLVLTGDSKKRLDVEKLVQKDSSFWSNLPWTKNGETLLKKVTELCDKHTIALCILSSCVSEDSKKGKQQWLARNTKIPEINQFFVMSKTSKNVYANSRSVLIDDYQKNVEEFKNAGGVGILYKNDVNKIIEELENVCVIDDDI